MDSLGVVKFDPILKLNEFVEFQVILLVEVVLIFDAFGVGLSCISSISVIVI